MESDIGMLWGAGRIADAINFLGGIIALWVAERFAFVAVERDANIFAKITITIFGLWLVVTNLAIYVGSLWTWEGAARNLQGLKDSGVSLSPHTTDYIETFGGLADPSLLDKPITLLLNLSVLALIIGILWFKPKPQD